MDGVAEHNNLQALAANVAQLAAIVASLSDALVSLQLETRASESSREWAYERAAIANKLESDCRKFSEGLSR
jgi:hypothetical protein